jgi:farnesol dehydrogenase
MRVLVTGGTGYLGRAVVRAFAAAGHDLVVMARRASQQPLPARLVDGDIRDLDAVARAIAGCDAVCHLAATVSIWRARPGEFDEVNVGGLRNVLDASAARDVKVVVTSSFLALPPRGGALPMKANDYQRTKVLAEQHADAAVRGGANVVRLYPGVIYGPGVLSEGNLVGRLVGDYLRGRLPGIIGGDRIWSFAWVDDVAAAYVSAADRAERGSMYQLGGENVPQRRLFELVTARSGTRMPLPIPASLA